MRKHRIWYGAILAISIIMYIVANSRAALALVLGLFLVPVVCGIVQKIAMAKTTLMSAQGFLDLLNKLITLWNLRFGTDMICFATGNSAEIGAVCLGGIVENPENVLEDQNLVKWFLTDYKKGNAISYVTAAVMAYRTAGYPESRLTRWILRMIIMEPKLLPMESGALRKIKIMKKKSILVFP